jgi:3-oxocholest-4-en-26-oate---CoA ligase
MTSDPMTGNAMTSGPVTSGPVTMDVNLADLCAAIAAALPDRCALVCDGDRLSYPELIARSNQVAQHLIGAGLEPDENVGLYLLNSAAYIESLLGCMVARAVPVNINYRYTGNELSYLLRSGQLAALVVDAEHAALAAAVAPSCPSLRHVLIVGGDPQAVSFPAGITVLGYEAAVGTAPATRPENGRNGGDKLIIYTGGTTGLPKGVLWRHEDFFFSALAGGNHYGPPRLSVEEIVAAAAEVPSAGYLITAPMMHGAGTYTLFSAFLLGSKVVISRRFDAAQTLRLVRDEQAMALAVVGDAMARPLADELAAHPGEYDLSSLFILGSGGALLSDSVRAQWQGLLPDLYITNRFGASETGTDGQLDRGEDGQPRLVHSGNVQVLDEQLRPVPAGQTGRIAKSGHVPLGYFGDEAASRATFPVIDGVRFALLGDLARVEDDGSIVVLGRGSTCINTGGEKVFPEEVEQVLKAHPAVLDAVVAGVPDDRFGERVAAVVELRTSGSTGASVPASAQAGAVSAGAAAGDAGATAVVSAEELREHCRAMIAGYKVPARIVFVPSVVRSPSGKADYPWARGVLAGAQAG